MLPPLFQDWFAARGWQPRAHQLALVEHAQRGDSVLHIGCGTGYYAAIFAEVVGEGGRVVALEVDPELARRAQRNLAPWPQVRVENADASELHDDAFDVIYVNAGATHARREWLAAMYPHRLFAHHPPPQSRPGRVSGSDQHQS